MLVVVWQDSFFIANILIKTASQVSVLHREFLRMTSKFSIRMMIASAKI